VEFEINRAATGLDLFPRMFAGSRLSNISRLSNLVGLLHAVRLAYPVCHDLSVFVLFEVFVAK
jgi:hypothetical protein